MPVTNKDRYLDSILSRITPIVPTPRVSVLMPVYNAAPTLEAALESLQVQTLKDFEIIAVDDGSTDGSRSILRKRQQRDSRLRPAFEPHRGLVHALNKGLELSQGQLIARMDADDLSHPQRLEKQVRLLEDEPQVSVVGSLVKSFPQKRQREGFRIYVDWLNHLVSHREIVREIFIESPIVHPSAMVRHRELLELGAYQDRGWAEDYDLWLRYFTAGRRFAKVPEVLLSWREHPTRLTRTDSRYSVESFLRAKAFYLSQGPLQKKDAVIVWGAGKTGRRLSKHLVREGCRLTAFVDIAPNKIGRTLHNLPIVGPSVLPELWRRWKRSFLLAAVASRGARTLIRQQLERLQLKEGEDFLCVA